MTDTDFSALFKQASSGDTAAYAKLYGLVYRSLYRIARFSVKSDASAVDIIRDTVTDSFSAAPSVSFKNAQTYAQWMIRILCTKIKLANKTESDTSASGSAVRRALDILSPDERMLLAVMTVCKCQYEAAAKLCGYEKEKAEKLYLSAKKTLNTIII